MRLDIGGRIGAPEGHKTLDRVPPADFIADLEGSLESVGYGRWDEIRAHNVLEHVHDLCGLMDELWKLLKDGGILDIEVPRFPTFHSVADPTHVRFFVAGTFDYFIDLKYFNYVKHYWECEEKPFDIGDFIRIKLKKYDAPRTP